MIPYYSKASTSDISARLADIILSRIITASFNVPEIINNLEFRQS